MKVFFVICEQTCPTCQGVRVITNPLWERYFCETAGSRDPDAWAREQGFDCALDIGPEEVPCEDCEGSGVVQSRESLAQALHYLQRHQGQQDHATSLS